METKEIGGVLYKLVPEEKEESCEGCAFKDSVGAICTIFSKDCNEGLIYKKVDELISTSNLKPFNLEAAKAGKPVCTRDGRKARVLCYDFKQNEEYPILVAVEDKDGKERVMLYSNSGISEMYESRNYELAILPEKKTGWININKDKGIFKSREEAERNCSDNYVVVEVEWEE